jgi:DNA polymerase-3 subunit gamma/tau
MAQIVGQEPVVRTLGRAIDTGRIAHAYLFSGPRGTGKTSTAKVLAMGLNCRNSDGPTSEPCGECESCRAISNNSSLDVLEMDAASNRGIDEIRELRDKVSLAPSSGRYKVYIIDEVHMLTTEAFNALLKMLEEPPEHAIFVLATTEKHKVLSTIISRCQSFDFKRPGVQVLADKLAEISAAEGIDAEPEALTVIARAGGGSFRDAEGLLDQLSSFAEGRITATMVRDLLGSAGTAVLAEATEALHERRTADALRLIDRISNEGRDLGQFTNELLEHLRRVMLFPHAPEVALAEVGEAGEERDRLQSQAETIPTAEIVRFVDTLGESLGRAKRGGDPKLELELTFLRLTRDYSEPSVEALMARIESLENALANGAAPPVQPPETAKGPGVMPSPGSPAPALPAPPELESEEHLDEAVKPAREQGELDQESGAEAGTGESEAGEPETASQVHASSESEPHDEPPASERTEETNVSEASEISDGTDEGDGAQRIASQWKSMMQELKRNRQALTAAVYEEARVAGFDGALLKLSFPEEQSFYVGMANDRKHADALGKILEERLGSRPRLEIAVHDGTEPPFATSGAETSGSSDPGSVPNGTTSPNSSTESSGPEANSEAPSAAEEPPEDAATQAAHDGPRSASENGEGPAQAQSEAPGGGAPDDIIRDPREVVELARQRFGNSGGNGRDISGRGGGS